MVIVDTNDRRQEFGAMYAYLAPERTFLWAVGDVDPPDGKVVGAVVNIIYPA